MWMQVHEMLHIERGGEEQIAGELEAYNPLIPRGDALIATLMLEIDDPTRRERELYRLAGIEDTIRLEVGGTAVAAQPIEDEVARTSEDGKTSSIHFLRFPFPPAVAARFRTPGARVQLGIDHPAYRPPRHHVGGDPRRLGRRPGRGDRLSAAPPFPAVRAQAVARPRGRSRAPNPPRRRARCGTSPPRSRADRR